MKAIKWTLGLFAVLAALWFAGPKVPRLHLDKSLPEVPGDLKMLENMVNTHERQVAGLKPDNEARIVWYDSAFHKTPYSIVYLHGFSASQAEGAPLHREIARRYGCNLYLSRLYGHGVEVEEPMLDLTAEKLVESAKEAIAIGEKIGEKVIVMSTSTGGTLGLYLAGQDPAIAGLILLSPNVKIYDPNSWLLDEHWGLQIARLVKGSDYIEWQPDSAREKYWTYKYRLEAVTHLEELITETMTPETFEVVNQPVFLGYYYRNDTAQDNTVSVPAMLDMYEQLGTPDKLKRKVAFPHANHHVIGSYLTSRDLSSVRQEIFSFLDDVMKLPPALPEKDN